MFSILSDRGAAASKASNDEVPQASVDHVATTSQHCQHHVATTCPHCAAIALAEQRRHRLEPDVLEPAEHAQLVLRSLQDSRKIGNVIAREIAAIYAEICEKANVVEIPTRDLLRELGKITKKSR